ncbi:MAG TPA: 4-alpha-glucanotransferase [Candidatus Binatia bacterium]|nr:4-alpha-glucanotransferase [Candidatus Binatia bacterium]
MPEPSPGSWGVIRRYTATDGTRRGASRRTVAAVLSALAAGPRGPEGEAGWPLVIVQGRQPEVGRAEVELENGESVGCAGRLPASLPLGYHRLHAGGLSRSLIVTPPRCHLPRQPGFGFSVQLYAARSAASWGIGDLADLAELARWARTLGASLLQVSPLHAALPVSPVEASPYFPTSRLFLNPLHLRPEGNEDDPGYTVLAGEAGRLNRRRRIDRDSVTALKLRALERSFESSAAAAAEAGAAMREHPRLRDFSLFCALAERHGPDWRDWPRPLARREGAALQTAARELAGRVRFHAWLQSQLDRQMKAAAAELPLICDLAVGVNPGGADAWLWQELIAPGITVGAPPDTFNTRGQDWGLPAFDPWKLRAAAYAPVVETLRAGLRFGGGLRIDHVMGLERLWWIPAGMTPAEGAYVRYPLEDLLGIVALESVRHRALVVGEDLGTVPRGLRARLHRCALLSYVVLLFEERPPRSWPRRALAAVTTHDLPTIAGLWDGSDLETRRRLGLPADAAADKSLVERVCRGGLERDAGAAAAILHAYRRLAESPALIVAATLEDVTLTRQRPNQPGLKGGPNWSTALPVPIERLETLPMAARLATVLSRRM